MTLLLPRCYRHRLTARSVQKGKKHPRRAATRLSDQAARENSGPCGSNGTWSRTIPRQSEVDAELVGQAMPPRLRLFNARVAGNDD
jgi:hypothetical protein